MTVAGTPEERSQIRAEMLAKDSGFATTSYAEPDTGRTRAGRKARRRAESAAARVVENEARYETRTADQALAAQYAAGYAGNFGFMVSMRKHAIRYGTTWTPTPKETAAILRCRRRAIYMQNHPHSENESRPQD